MSQLRIAQSCRFFLREMRLQAPIVSINEPSCTLRHPPPIKEHIMTVSAKRRTKIVSAIIASATALALCAITLAACSAADTENESSTKSAPTEESSPNSEEAGAAESDGAELTEEDADEAESAGDRASSGADNETPAESAPSQTANTNDAPAKQPAASSNQGQTSGSDSNNTTAPSTDRAGCYHDWQLNIVKTYQPIRESAMLCNECELWMKSEAEIDAHIKANGWGTSHGGWHSGTHYAGYCANCGGHFEYVQDHFSRPNCHNQYIQNCSCGNNSLVYYNGAGIVVDGKTCSLCGATDPNW